METAQTSVKSTEMEFPILPLKPGVSGTLKSKKPRQIN